MIDNITNKYTSITEIADCIYEVFSQPHRLYLLGTSFLKKTEINKITQTINYSNKKNINELIDSYLEDLNEMSNELNIDNKISKYFNPISSNETLTYYLMKYIHFIPGTIFTLVAYQTKEQIIGTSIFLLSLLFYKNINYCELNGKINSIKKTAHEINNHLKQCS